MLTDRASRGIYLTQGVAVQHSQEAALSRQPRSEDLLPGDGALRFDDAETDREALASRVAEPPSVRLSSDSPPT